MSRAGTAAMVPLSDVRAALGESPVWSPRHKAVWWVDIDGRRLFRTALDGTTVAWETPEFPGFVQCLGDAVLVGMESGIFRLDPAEGRFGRLVRLGTSGQRFNDACTDGQGRIWAGTMDLENKRDDGALYLFEPTRGTLARKLDGFRTINGLAWDPSRRRLYLSDSHPEVQTVWTCPVNSESAPGERAVFARFHDLDGRPDGAALDGCRNYWIAGVGGGAIYRFLPDGDMLCWSVPVQSPTKPAFVPGRDGTAMVLTSRRDNAQGGRLAIWQDPPGVG